MGDLRDPDKIKRRGVDPTLQEQLPAVDSRGLTELKAGEIVGGRYKVLSVIGHGGNGIVYAVEQVFLKQTLALKTLHPIGRSDVAAIRFQKEAQAANKLEHPNLVRAVDFGMTQDGQPFLAMELVPGESLAELLKKRARLSVAEALQIFIPVCSALDYAHQYGITHRDIKPGNILLVTQADGQKLFPKIVDFGIAKFESSEAEALTKTGEVFGTPLYMSPEQCSGIKVDNRSDIYSLGCVLYEVLTGGPPFRGKTAIETITQQMTAAPLSLKEASLGLDFPPQIQSIVSKALAKEPAQRYQTCAEFGNDLKLFQQGKLGTTVTPERNKPSIRWLAIVASVVAFVSVAALAKLQFDKQYHATGESQVADSTADSGAGSGAGAPGVTERPTQTTSSPLAFDSSGSAITSGALPTGKSNHEKTFPNPKELEFYSEIEGTGASARRRYSFGPNSIGSISYADATGSEGKDINAKGIVYVPANQKINLHIDWVDLCDAPTTLLKFKKEEVKGLITESGKHASILSEKSTDGTFDMAMNYGRALTDIIILDFHRTPITMEGLQNIHLEKFHTLKVLKLGFTEIEGADFMNKFKNIIPRLTELDVSSIANVRAILQGLKNSRNIIILELQNDKLDLGDVKILCTMPNLASLDLRKNPGITDDGVTMLEQLASLNYLALNKTGVTVRSLPELSKMTRLLTLSLSKDRWSETSMATLRQALPNCQISFGE